MIVSILQGRSPQNSPSAQRISGVSRDLIGMTDVLEDSKEVVPGDDQDDRRSSSHGGVA